MSLMKDLFGQFCDEIDGVEEYSKCAMAATDDQELNRMYREMASAELQHATMLHSQILKRGDRTMEEGEAEMVLQNIWEDKKDDMAGKMADMI